MSVNIIYQKKYKNGLCDYTDAKGNIIDYEEEYDPEVQYYIDTTVDEREAQRLRSQKVLQEIAESRKDSGKMFVSNKLAPSEIPAFAGMTSIGPRQPLWGGAPTTYVSGHSNKPPVYWSERELCILAGDTGTGKTLLGLQVAKALAGGCVLGNDSNIGKPRKVLYIDFELDKDSFLTRYGEPGYTQEFLDWASYNAPVSTARTTNCAEWLMETLKDYCKENKPEVVIIDQLDRMHINPQKWCDLLFNLKMLINDYGLAIMLVVSTKPRNYAQPLELSHIYNHRTLCQAADSVVGIGMDYNNEYARYIKPFKMKNRVLRHGAKLEGFMVDYLSPNSSLVNGGESNFPVTEESPNQVGDDGFNVRLILKIFLTAAKDEEDYLKPTKAMLREQKIMTAEAMRKDGHSVRDIAFELNIAEGTAKRWVSAIPPAKQETIEKSAAWGEPLNEDEIKRLGFSNMTGTTNREEDADTPPAVESVNAPYLNSGHALGIAAAAPAKRGYSR